MVPWFGGKSWKTSSGSLFIFVLLIIFAGISLIVDVATSAPLPLGDNPYWFSSREEALIDRVGAGFYQAIHRRDGSVWRECGERTPPEEQPARARDLVKSVYTALRDNGLTSEIYLWATSATIWQESRGDPCAVGPLTRRWAVEQRLIGEGVHFTRYNRDDVRRMVNSRAWKSRRRRVGADLGIGQNVWKKWAKMRDPITHEERYATIDEILSVDGGAQVVAYQMRGRMKWYNTPQPWRFWPGRAGRATYPKMIARIVNWMGGPWRLVYTWNKKI